MFLLYLLVYTMFYTYKFILLVTYYNYRNNWVLLLECVNKIDTVVLKSPFYAYPNPFYTVVNLLYLLLPSWRLAFVILKTDVARWELNK